MFAAMAEQRCKETAGFLFSHPCADQAAGNCTQCSKPVCLAHMRDGKCVSCLRQGGAADPADPLLAAGHYYPDYHALSTHDSYTKKDRSAFTGEEAAADSDWESEWENDFDGT